MPRTPAGRRAQGRARLRHGAGHHRLQHRARRAAASFWAAVTGNVPEMRGAYNIDNKLRHVLDLVSSAKATKTSLTLRHPQGRELELGRPQAAGDVQGLRRTRGARSSTRRTTSRTAPATTRSPATPTRATSRSRSSGRSRMPTGRTSSAAIYPSQALAGLDFNSIWTTCLCGNDGKPVSDGPFLLTNYTRGPGRHAEAQPVLVRQEAGARTRSTSRSSPTRTPRFRRCAAARSTRSTRPSASTCCR